MLFIEGPGFVRILHLKIWLLDSNLTPQYVHPLTFKTVQWHCILVWAFRYLCNIFKLLVDKKMQSNDDYNIILQTIF